MAGLNADSSWKRDCVRKQMGSTHTNIQSFKSDKIAEYFTKCCDWFQAVITSTRLHQQEVQRYRTVVLVGCSEVNLTAAKQSESEPNLKYKFYRQIIVSRCATLFVKLLWCHITPRTVSQASYVEKFIYMRLQHSNIINV